MTETTEVANQSDENQIANIEQFNNIEDMKNFAQQLIDSGLVPNNLKKPEQLVAIILQGRELGMPPVASINNIHNIQGKATLGVNVIGALLKKSGIEYQTVKDAEYVEKERKDENGNPKTITDKVTTIRFYKVFHGNVIEDDVSFSWKESKKAELTEKDNWKKYPNLMLWNRCFAIGARRNAPEALLGIYEQSEIADVTNTDYVVNKETGEAEIKS